MIYINMNTLLVKKCLYDIKQLIDGRHNVTQEFNVDILAINIYE